MLRGLDQLMERKEDRDVAESVGNKARHECGLSSSNGWTNEHTIQTLEDILRACVIDFGGSWDTHLPLAEFSYNNSYHSSIRCDQVLLKVSPWKGVVRFGKKGKLAPRYVRPFEILERIGEIKVDKTLRFVEEPIEIMDREVKKLKHSRIPIVKVHWNSKRGPTDYMKTSQEDHEVHLKLALELLKREKLFAKFYKCEFWLEKASFLRHVVNDNNIHVDSSYYRRFIANFSKIAKPLTTLTQKDQKRLFSLLQRVKSRIWMCIDAKRQDHKSLQHIFDQKELNMRQWRWIELFSDYECEIFYHPGKANVVADTVDVQAENVQQNVAGGSVWPGPTNGKEGRGRSSSGYDANWVIVDRLTKSAHFLAIREDYKMEKLARLYIDEIVAGHGVPASIISNRYGRFTSRFLANITESLRDAFGYECGSSSSDGWTNYYSSIRCAPFEALYGRKCRSPVLWAKIGESMLIGPELVQETTNKVVLLKERLKAAGDRQKSYADNRLKPLGLNIEQFLNRFAEQPNETNINDLEPDNGLVDTPLVSPFSHTDNDSDDEEVLNELCEYENTGTLRRERIMNSFDGDDLAFECMTCFGKFTAYLDPFLPMNIISHKAYNTIMVERLEETGKNLVAIVRDVYLFVKRVFGLKKNATGKIIAFSNEWLVPNDSKLFVETFNGKYLVSWSPPGLSIGLGKRSGRTVYVEWNKECVAAGWIVRVYGLEM
ncbi:putative reverse transcriptase domain-containing protein [Tanacetum coccineum]